MMSSSLTTPPSTARLFGALDVRWYRYAGLAFAIATLNLLTLGLYKPYGLTRMRQRLYNNIYMGRDRLHYKGDAKSLARVTFYPSLVFLFVLIVPSILSLAVGWTFALVLGAVQMLGVVYVHYFLSYKNKRYEWQQIEWRGLSFTLPTEAAAYARSAFADSLLSLLTLGLYSPWGRLALARQTYGQLTIGRHIVAFDTSQAKLIPLYIAGWLCTMVGAVGMGYYYWTESVQPAIALFQNGGYSAETMEINVALLNPLVDLFTLYGLWYAWRQLCLSFYEHRYWQGLLGGLRCKGAQLIYTGSWWSLLWRNLLAFQMNYCLANLARPFTDYLKIRHFVENIVLDKSENLFTA